MGFFSNMYTKEGPGVRKDQPPKKGIPRFFEILMRDYGHLLKVNFLFLLCCLPMVTVVLFGLLFWEPLAMLGVAFFGFSVVFQLLTLPVEFNASSRAMKALRESGVLTEEELSGARKVLTAAAMTYVAALFLSLMSFLRLLLIVGGRGRND